MTDDEQYEQDMIAIQRFLDMSDEEREEHDRKCNQQIMQDRVDYGLFNAAMDKVNYHVVIVHTTSDCGKSISFHETLTDKQIDGLEEEMDREVSVQFMITMTPEGQMIMARDVNNRRN